MEYPIISGSAVVVALIGFYFVVRVWVKWKDIDIDVIKARAFLDKKFLVKNWIYIFLAGAFLAIHQFFDFLMSVNYSYMMNGWVIQLSMLSEILEFFVLVFLTILAYDWFTILYKK